VERLSICEVTLSHCGSTRNAKPAGKHRCGWHARNDGVVVLQEVGAKRLRFDLTDVVILDVPCAMTWSNRKRQRIILIRKATDARPHGARIGSCSDVESICQDQALYPSSHDRRHAIPSALFAGNPSAHVMEAIRPAVSVALKRPAPTAQDHCSAHCRRAR
jgi:hypothetical protein